MSFFAFQSQHVADQIRNNPNRVITIWWLFVSITKLSKTDDVVHLHLWWWCSALSWRTEWLCAVRYDSAWVRLKNTPSYSIMPAGSSENSTTLHITDMTDKFLKNKNTQTRQTIFFKMFKNDFLQKKTFFQNIKMYFCVSFNFHTEKIPILFHMCHNI